MCMETRTCQNCKEPFIIQDEDDIFYKKMGVPAPTFCPSCRLIQRLSWRNERTLHQRTCDLCGNFIISVFAKDSGYTVYCASCWWSDKWDGLTYGIDFDEKPPFLTQLNRLFHKVPLSNLFGLYPTLVNSPYVNMGSRMKDCYFLTHSMLNENSAYGASITNTKDSVDNLLLDQGELCYDCVNCQKCYQTMHSVDCENCHDVYFSKNLSGCSNCIGCVNLRNKQYYLFNKECSKEEYDKKLTTFNLDSFEGRMKLAKKAYDHWAKFPQKFMHERHNSNVGGDYIYNSKNTFHTYIASDMEDSKFCSYITPGGAKNCYDMTHYASHSELLYNSLQVGDQASRVISTWYATTGIQEIEHSMFIIGGNNIFGCVGLRKQKYCILNKQYTKENYEALRKTIVQQMEQAPYKDLNGNAYHYGDFFPTEMSPFGYNETTAQEYFPLQKEQAQGKGYPWRDVEKSTPSATLKKSQLPDTIANVDDTILQGVVECAHNEKCNEQCTGAFRVIGSETAFYKTYGISLPLLCPNCRHYQRLKSRNPLQVWHRSCQCKQARHLHGNAPCANVIKSSWSPDRPELVYCEQCYQAEFV